MQVSAKLRSIMGPHIVDVLKAGQSVVLDFQANTVASRNWMRDLFETAKANHELHVLAPPDEVCLQRLHARNAKGDHPFAATEAQFYEVSKYIVLPQADEGFNMIVHDHAA